MSYGLQKKTLEKEKNNNFMYLFFSRKKNRIEGNFRSFLKLFFAEEQFSQIRFFVFFNPA